MLALGIRNEIIKDEETSQSISNNIHFPINVKLLLKLFQRHFHKLEKEEEEENARYQLSYFNFCTKAGGNEFIPSSSDIKLQFFVFDFPLVSAIEYIPKQTCAITFNRLGIDIHDVKYV